HPAQELLSPHQPAHAVPGSPQPLSTKQRPARNARRILAQVLRAAASSGKTILTRMIRPRGFRDRHWTARDGRLVETDTSPSTARSGPIILFQVPEPLELSVPLAGLEAVDRHLLGDLAGTERVIQATILCLLKHLSKVVGTGESVGFQLGEPTVAPACRNLVSRQVGTVRMGAIHVMAVHQIEPQGCQDYDRGGEVTHSLMHFRRRGIGCALVRIPASLGGLCFTTLPKRPEPAVARMNALQLPRS